MLSYPIIKPTKTNKFMVTIFQAQVRKWIQVLFVQDVEIYSPTNFHLLFLCKQYLHRTLRLFANSLITLFVVYLVADQIIEIPQTRVITKSTTNVLIQT